MSNNTTTTPRPPSKAEDFERVKKWTAVTFLFASPILIALPPRKLDLYTVSLGTAFIFSANHLTTVRTGRNIPQYLFSSDRASHMLSGLPTEKAEKVHAQLRAQREAQIHEGNLPPEELEKLKRKQSQQKGIAERIWMGTETEGWEERRLKEQQKALEEGKGYGDLIKDYIWEAWHGPKESKAENDETERKNDGKQ